MTSGKCDKLLPLVLGASEETGFWSVAGEIIVFFIPKRNYEVVVSLKI